MLISIDHGNKQVKTIHHAPFTSGLVCSEVRPFGGETLTYQGRYYTLTDQRIPYRRDKTEDERFFVLTLFAIAYELETASFYGAGPVRVQLAVGLPPAHYGAQQKRFAEYFLNRGTVSFTLHDRQYEILIDEVSCYPQSYAAAITVFQTLQSSPRALIIDIGGFTADYLLLRNGEGDLSVCDSLENGVILLYNRIKSRVAAEQDLLLDEAEIDRRVHEAAEFVGLDPALLERSPFELSGGQKRRVAVAGVMAMKPRILVLDEPAAGLDPEGRDDILSEVKEYHKKTGTTVLLVSHSMEDIAKYANRVLVMSNKKIAMYDTVEKVFARAPELLELGLSVPQVTKIFLKLREMGVDVPADVYTIPYAVKTLLEAKRRRDAGESLVLPRSAAQKGGAV